MHMRVSRGLLLALLIPFTLLTGVALVADGLGGIPGAITHSWASLQIFVDLVLAVVILCILIHRDATSRRRNPWPWIVGAALVGMFSPLVYLLTRPSED